MSADATRLATLAQVDEIAGMVADLCSQVNIALAAERAALVDAFEQNNEFLRWLSEQLAQRPTVEATNTALAEVQDRFAEKVDIAAALERAAAANQNMTIVRPVINLPATSRRVERDADNRITRVIDEVMP